MVNFSGPLSKSDMYSVPRGWGGAGLGWVVCRGISGNYVDLGSFETMREEVDHPRRKTFARYRTMASTSM